MSIEAAERDKYERVFKYKSYSKFSPGERLFKQIVGPRWAYPKRETTIIDLGCGSGKASIKFLDARYQLVAVDLTSKGISPARWKRIEPCFVQAPLWDLTPCWSRVAGRPQRVGWCTDVMEHIPTEYVMLTLREIASLCTRVHFQICTQPDQFGQIIGEPLHLTVKPFTWWRDRLAETFREVVDARDLMHSGYFEVRA